MKKDFKIGDILYTLEESGFYPLIGEVIDIGDETILVKFNNDKTVNWLKGDEKYYFVKCTDFINELDKILDI